MIFYFIEGEYLAHAVTVEEGAKAILECPGFVPNPLDRREKLTVFSWYKAKASDILINGSIINHDGRVALYDKSDGAKFTFGDLIVRATIDGISGALEIPLTMVSDGHIYTCHFISTASGDTLKEAQLVITGECYYSNLKYVYLVIIAVLPNYGHNIMYPYSITHNSFYPYCL